MATLDKMIAIWGLPDQSNPKKEGKILYHAAKLHRPAKIVIYFYSGVYVEGKPEATIEYLRRNPNPWSAKLGDIKLEVNGNCGEIIAQVLKALSRLK